MMERLIPQQMTASTNATYQQSLVDLVNYITNTKGAYAIVDPHNFGRYYSNIITDTSGFEAWWKTTATLFASNSKVIFDCNNEPHDMGANSVVTNLNQACINGVSGFSPHSAF